MKKFIVPLQAFAVLLFCSGIAWMIFVLASINPVPPTATDLQARNTQDLSFANMNSTAVSLAKEMLEDMVPSPSGRFYLPVTGRETATPQPNVAMTLKVVSTFSNSPTPFSLFSYIFPATPTREKPDRPAPTATRKPSPTSAPTLTLPPPTFTTAPTQTKPPTSPPPTETPNPTKPPTEQPTEQPTNPPPLPTETPIDPPTLEPTQNIPDPVLATNEPPPTP